MMNKRHNPFGAEPGPMLKADGHLSDAWLLLAIDGELTASDHAQLKEHVRACWSCRARKEYLERTIEDIVDYEQALVASDMPPSAGGRAIFMARLDELAADMGQPSLLNLWRRVATQIWGTLFTSKVGWITAALLIVAAIPLLYVLRRPAVVSAHELLQRAALEESHSIVGVNQPVVVQTISIRINGRKLTRTVYRDETRKRQVSRTDVGPTEVSLAERKFLESSLRWDDPLSPEAFSHWRDGVAEKRDAVSVLSGNRLKLDTTAESGPIAEASFTVRADDFHPVAEDLRLRDNTQIEIAELSYDVVGLPSLSPDPFEPITPLEPLRLPERAESTPSLSAAGIHPNAAQLAASMLDVQTALHRIGADLGEEISVQEGPGNRVLINGLVADDGRKQQVDTALAGIPFTELHVATIAQAAVHPQSDRKPAESSGASVATLVAENPPLLQDQLKKRFPDADQRSEYVNQSLAICQSASARAWALNRLADRYTPQQVSLLDRDGQQKLQTLLSDHVAALREDVSRLQNQLGQILSSTSNTAAANTAVGTPQQGAPSPSAPDDWRSRIHRVHSSVETADEAVSVLLAGSQENGGSSDRLQIQLRTTLTQLQAELQSLGQQVHNQF
jgi:hypothetical protein